MARRPPRIGRWSARTSSFASPTPPRLPSDTHLQTRAGRVRRLRSISACSVSSTSKSSGTKRQFQSRPSAIRRALSSVPSPRRTSIRTKLAVVGDFLHRLRRELDKEAVARLGEPLEQHVLPGGEKQVPRHRPREVAVGLLDQQAVAEIEDVAVEGQLVAVARLFEQMRRLPDQVERQVRKAEVDLQHRAMPAPFAKALTEDQRVIAEAQKIVEARGIRARRRQARRSCPSRSLRSAGRSAAASHRMSSPRQGWRRRSGGGRSCRPPAEQLARLLRSDAMISAEGTTRCSPLPSPRVGVARWRSASSASGA